jgi:hypothetical protein
MKERERNQERKRKKNVEREGMRVPRQRPNIKDDPAETNNM